MSQSTKNVLSGASLPTENFLILSKTEGKTDEDMLFLNGAHPRTKDGAVAQSVATESPAAESEQPAASASSEASLDAQSGGEVTTAAANLQKWWGQQIPFKTLVSSGALSKKADGTYTGAGGFTMGWDNCSNTPYLFNLAQRTVISYDGEFVSTCLNFHWELIVPRPMPCRYLVAERQGQIREEQWHGGLFHLVLRSGQFRFHLWCFYASDSDRHRIRQDDGYALQNVVRKALGK